MSLKLDRISSSMIREINDIIAKDINDHHIKNNLICINEVEVTKDYGLAKVYITVLNEQYKNEAVIALNRASRFIENLLFKRIDIAKMPKLEFVYDESVKQGEKIERIINELK